MFEMHDKFDFHYSVRQKSNFKRHFIKIAKEIYTFLTLN